MKKNVISIIGLSVLLASSSMFATSVVAYENNGLKTDIHDEVISYDNEEEVVVNKVRNFGVYGQTSSTATLKWDEPETTYGLVEYIVYKDGKEIDRVPAGKNGYTARDLSVNRLYGFKVTAKYSNDKESKPESINIRTHSSDQNIIINKAQNIITNDVTQNSFTLNWEEPKNTYGLVEYIIYKDGKEITSVPAGTNKYKLNGLRANTIYGAKVVAKYLNGEKSKPVSVNVRTTK